jgi:hypothetical protein
VCSAAVRFYDKDSGALPSATLAQPIFDDRDLAVPTGESARKRGFSPGAKYRE